MKYRYRIKLKRLHGLEIYCLDIYLGEALVHTSTHLSQGGAENRARRFAQDNRRGKTA